MQVKQLDHLNLSVQNFDTTVDWYGRVFGFELVEEDVQDGVRWGVIRSGEAMLCIYEHPEHESTDRWKLARRKHHGVAHFGLRVTDADTWRATLAREALPILYGGPVEWQHSVSWYINDPTGYEIEVVSWNHDQIHFEPLGATA